MDHDIGARLKELREKRRFSQRQLAALTGVTGGMISMIEQNRSSPSVATLKKILTGLGISLSDFFSSGEDPAQRWYFRAEDLREITPESRGAEPGRGVVFRQIGRPGASAVQMLHETYAPGADTGKPMLQHDGEEGGIVLRGQIEIMVGDQSRVLETGDAYYFDSRQPHRFRNRGDQECELISVCTPPSF